LLSQELTQRSGTFVTDIPPEQFGEKKPNFNLFLFRMGDCFRPMKPQSNPVAGFYPIDNLRIMPENSNCSSLVDDEAVEVQVWRQRSEKVRLMALSMDNVGLRRSLRTYAS
jgi:hypothetical protein